MKLIVASIYTNYTTYIIDDEGIEQLDRMIASPAGEKLVLGFNRIPKVWNSLVWHENFWYDLKKISTSLITTCNVASRQHLPVYFTLVGASHVVWITVTIGQNIICQRTIEIFISIYTNTLLPRPSLALDHFNIPFSPVTIAHVLKRYMLPPE